MLPRSYLFVPADRPDRFDAAAASGTDAIILDLEDGTAWSEKERGRTAVHEWLHKGHPEGIEVWVRVNGGDLLHDDLDASMGADGVFLPKINGPGAIEDVASHVGDDLKIIAMIETARALLRCEQIGGHDAVTGLMIGEFYLAADLGLRYDTMGRGLDPARLQVVTVSAAYG
ncbi:MAG: CoA ester lyase, partial [Acidimicrobiia bacterium]|nr:CoA ester lyase [Acidimicrobiia bacterium]